jgi:glycosyltransferase involved in cell wall biosynthesis
MAECVRRSALIRHWPVQVIPYPIDLEAFRPSDQAWARDQLGLPQDVPLLLFAAQGGTSDPRKGFDLLQQALAQHESGSGITPLSRIELLVLGDPLGQDLTSLGVPIHSPGHIEDTETLCQYYSAADVVIIPSRVANLPTIGLEANACGTPVVAFRTSGLQDIVAEHSTGIMAEPFDVDSLRQAIIWVLSDPLRPRHLGAQARARAESLWAPARIASMYADLYREVLAREGKGGQP